MELVADFLLVAGAVGAAVYCFVLSRRLRAFTDLEKGVGGAVAVLSSQVDDLRRTLDAARHDADVNSDALQALTERAQTTAQRLELLMASLHDLPVQPAPATDPSEERAVEADVPDMTAEPPVPEEPPVETAPTEAPTAAQPMFMRHPRAAREAAE